MKHGVECSQFRPSRDLVAARAPRPRPRPCPAPCSPGPPPRRVVSFSALPFPSPSSPWKTVIAQNASERAERQKRKPERRTSDPTPVDVNTYRRFSVFFASAAFFPPNSSSNFLLASFFRSASSIAATRNSSRRLALRYRSNVIEFAPAIDPFRLYSRSGTSSMICRNLASSASASSSVSAATLDSWSSAMRCSVDRAAYAAFFSEYSASAPLSAGGDAMNNQSRRVAWPQSYERFSFRTELWKESTLQLSNSRPNPTTILTAIDRRTDGLAEHARNPRNVAVFDRARRRDQPGSRATRL